MNGFLPLLNSGFHWDNGAMKWQQSSEGRGGVQSEIERMRRKKGDPGQQENPVSWLPLFYQPSPSLAHRDVFCVGGIVLDLRQEPSGSPAAGSFFFTPGPGWLSDTRDGLTHPVQAAQVLHHVLVCVWVVFDHSVLFVHTSRLQSKEKVKKMSFVQGWEWIKTLQKVPPHNNLSLSTTTVLVHMVNLPSTRGNVLTSKYVFIS